ncbi:hypothetical protein [Picosynechococcus sp. NKBG15041c]|nr:hypothetical protein [Picosynechococcus sp. NKBG15041c]
MMQSLATVVGQNIPTEFPKKLKGFTNAAKARDADFFSEKGKSGFAMML